jgi:hypothetical protein
MDRGFSHEFTEAAGAEIDKNEMGAPLKYQKSFYVS